jgi:dienelactone hydrolase
VRPVGRARVIFAILAAALVCAGGASAAPGWTQITIDASDATPLACAYITPSGTAPAGGWPGVILFHGLGQSHADMEPYGSALAQFGFAALTCDARGTGASGGRFGLDGARDVQDAQDLFSWFAGRSDVSDTNIGALGLSLGGGEVWNAAAAGVPFKAIVPAVTWTDLVRALAPANAPKEGLVFQLAQLYPGQWDTALAQARDDLLGGTVTQAVRAASAARSSRPKLQSLHVPTLILQGRHDFLFDLDQALAAYRLLAGPKRLYLGDLGHPPATNPAAEEPTYLSEALGWFEQYLAGGPKLGGGVELAHDPWDGTTTSYTSIPRTRRVMVNLPGTKKVFLDGSARRSVRLPGGPLETFGDGSLRVRYSGNGGQWTEIRAMISVKGSKAPITVGAAPLTKASGLLKIPLLDESVLIPRGRRLVVTVGATSADGVYTPIVGRGPPGTPPAITIHGITLQLSLLRRAVSR